MNVKDAKQRDGAPGERKISMWIQLARAAAFGFALAASGCASVSKDLYAPSAVDKAAWPYATPALQPEKEVIWGVLPNGLRYAIMPNKTPKRSVSLRLHIAAGSLDENDNQRGVAHFLEHMAFNGSKNVPEGDMVKILERFGLAFGPDTNAFTSFDQTVYQLDLPSNGDDIVDQGLLLLNETARNLTLAPDAIDRERGVIKSELRVRDTPAYRAYVAGAKFLMPEARLTQRLPIGERQIIETAPRSAFEELYRRAYRPDRAILVVTGDIDAAKIMFKINARFADWSVQGKPDETPKPGPVNSSVLDAGYFFDPEVKTSITFTFIKPPTNPADSVAERKLSMSRDLANAILSRRLRALARQADAKILGGAGYFDETYHAADMSTLLINAEPKNWKDALMVGEQELRRALSYGFTKAELDEQLSEMRASFRNAAEYAPTRKTSDLADALVGAAHDDLAFTHPSDDLALFESFARGINAKALSKKFRDDWGGVEPKIFVASNALIENPKTTVLETYKQSRAKPVAKPDKIASDAFAYRNFGAPGAVAERKEVADLGGGVKLVQMRFANNVRLNIVQTPFERDTVRAMMRICCGDLDLAAKPAGFPTYLESVFSLGGLEKHSADDLERLNAGRTADFDLSVDEDDYVLSGVVTPADLEWQLQVWAAELTAPGYRSEAQAIFQKNVAVWLETLDATPQSVLKRDLASILRGGDPRWTIPDRSAFEAFKLDDVRSALSQALTSGALEVSLVGDIDEARAVDLVAKTLGALPLRAAAPQPTAGGDVVPLPDFQGQTKKLTHAGPKNRAAAVVAWNVGDFQTDAARARRLRILTAIMDLKLTEELRERLGDTYSPSVDVDQSEVYKGVGVLKVTIDLEPEKIRIFYEELGQIVAAMAAGKISDDEFLRATRPIIEGLSKSEENNQYWLRVADQSQSRPETLAWHRSRIKDYEDATLPQIKALAKNLFKNSSALRIEVRPEGG